jgi:UDP-2,3-diacylglucosamine hydrolase
VSRLVIVGDVHLDRDDLMVERFVAFLDRLPSFAARIVLMGDLFNLWIGKRDLEQPHHREVAAALERLRGRGVVVRYVEGNRDYRIAGCYGGRAFDDVSDRGLVERCGGRSIFAVHGDLANPADLRYRSWRALSRSRLFWALFNAIPRARRARFAASLEARMRTTNLGYKRTFPEAAVRAYAGEYLAAGHDAVVLGHFHEERTLVPPGERPGRIYVLPLWSESPRHLEFGPDGEARFVDSLRS